MSLAQKVGQMTQPEIKSITPDQVRQYYIGSVLNGGGSWPERTSTPVSPTGSAWRMRYYDASMATDMPVPIPVIWGTDAVHGHSNVFGATLFPHNIGLGAARDPELVRRDRRGDRARRARHRHRLGLRADAGRGRERPLGPHLRELLGRPRAGAPLRRGAYAGPAGTHSGTTRSVVATAKHFLGDGGTANGKDQGDTTGERGAT